ncbi:MAG: hypothetical protein K2W94_08770 [Alphaproteobacteria bacterium]|nr:hypothetical protein [Alphaproteobacteria bacterium]
MNNHSIKTETLNFIKRHWKKVALGSVIFFLVRLLLFVFFAYWILSGIMNRRQDIQEARGEFKASFERMSEAFEKDFKARRSSLENSQNQIKIEFDQKKSDFDKAFQEGREKVEKKFKNFGKF